MLLPADKEVVHGTRKNQNSSIADDSSLAGLVPDSAGGSEKRPQPAYQRPTWKKRRIWITGLIFLIILIAAVFAAIGVTLHLTKQHKPAGQSAPPTSIQTSFSSSSALSSITSASSTSSPTSTQSPSCGSYNGPPLSTLPQSIPGPKPPNTPPPAGKINVNLTFDGSFAWPIVSASITDQQLILASMPQALAYAIGATTADIITGDILPGDTAKTLCYIATVAQTYIPGEKIASLKRQTSHRGEGKLWNNPDAKMKNLFSMVDKFEVG